MEDSEQQKTGENTQSGITDVNEATTAASSTAALHDDMSPAASVDPSETPASMTTTSPSSTSTTVSAESFVRKPNHQLTAAEKQAKKDLKAQLKQASRRRKFQVRYQQAVKRRDWKGAEQAQRDYRAYCQSLVSGKNNNNEAPLSLDDDDDNAMMPHRVVSPVEQQARRQVEDLYHQMQVRLQTAKQQAAQEASSEASSLSATTTSMVKEHRTEQARLLLRNMTKGTQQLNMFDNTDALRGYTQQKFIERAMLVVSSLCRLLEPPPSGTSKKDDDDDDKSRPSNDPSGSPQLSLDPLLPPQQQQFLSQLRQVRTVLCIGCGPGCDGVGFGAWLRALQNMYPAAFPEPSTTGSTNDDDPPNQQTETASCGSTLSKLIFLDWAVDQWKLILDPVSELLQPAWVDAVECGYCNVVDAQDRRPVDATTNRSWKEAAGEADLVLTCYLLSETRGRWEDWYTALSAHVRPGTLFWFADPTAWQLHQWLHLQQQKNNNHVDKWMWLDSSMHAPALQALEGRVGPAVLLARTKPK